MGTAATVIILGLISGMLATLVAMRAHRAKVALMFIPLETQRARAQARSRAPWGH